MGRVERGRKLFQKQRLPHAAPRDAEKTAVRLMIRLERLFTVEIGWAKMLFSFSTDRARVMVVRKRARGGTERRR